MITLHDPRTPQVPYSVKVGAYPDGTPLVTRMNWILPDEFYMRVDHQDFVAGIWFAEALLERGKVIKKLILPFIPGARQDRLNEDGDYLFTMKSVARMINALRVPRVVVLDPHSTVATALIDRCKVFPLKYVLTGSAASEAGIRADVVIAPDVGAAKRARELAIALNAEFVQGEKVRDVVDGSLSGFKVPKLDSRKKHLVVDDICDGGGTFVGLAKELRNQDVVADLYVTHGLFSKRTTPLLENFDKVFTTDSVISDKEGVTVLPVRDKLLYG